MPRKSRIDTPGALHHIIARGIERRPIFRDDQDRDDFLKRLAIVVEGYVRGRISYYKMAKGILRGKCCRMRILNFELNGLGNGTMS